MSEHTAQEDLYKVMGTFVGVVTITAIWLWLRNNAEWLTALSAQKQETNISVIYSGDTGDASSPLFLKWPILVCIIFFKGLVTL